jgi:hypothetical protein
MEEIVRVEIVGVVERAEGAAEAARIEAAHAAAAAERAIADVARVQAALDRHIADVPQALADAIDAHLTSCPLRQDHTNPKEPS